MDIRRGVYDPTIGEIMINALKALFQTIITFCSAANRLGNAADHMGRYLEESAKGFADAAAVERDIKLAALRGGTPAALPAPTSTVQ
jgi:hypothetical protein